MNALIPVYLATMTSLKEDIRSAIKTWPSSSNAPARLLAEEIHALLQQEIQHLEDNPSLLSVTLNDFNGKLRHFSALLPLAAKSHFSEYAEVIDELISSYAGN
ncbi:hypothetical protein [Leeia oryzae]|uniref:hypothetical protein n=1 Tax=Leeia oryzae TaxID=356662 RepID=UPI000360F252|nr:hypothetical protein [Leeia oryzae]